MERNIRWGALLAGALLWLGGTAGAGAAPSKLAVVPGEAEPQYGDITKHTSNLRTAQPLRPIAPPPRDRGHDDDDDDESEGDSDRESRSDARRSRSLEATAVSNGGMIVAQEEEDDDEEETDDAVAEIPTSALIVYDNRVGTAARKLGLVYAIMLRNLLGHFNLTVDLLPVESYTAGRIGSYGALFYLGVSYDNPLPAAFLSDVASTDKRVVWFRYNIWQLAWNASYGFSAKSGLDFVALRGLNALPSAANPIPGFFDDVRYKDRSFIKYYAYDAATNTISADPDAGEMRIVDSTKASAPVEVQNTVSGASIPYIARGGNFWYVADIPFSYIGPRDRYLVMTDMLHDMLGIAHTENHRAMVRLEDLNALIEPNTVTTLADDLSTKGIPFGVAVTPYYRDPLGVYNGGTPQQIHLNAAGAADLRSALNYAKGKGGQFLLHGYTHQYDARPNPYSAVTSEDFEFWDIVNNAVLPEDSVTWAANRITSGRTEMVNSGFTPYAWETPHYQGSPNAYAASKQRFTTRYERSVYYTATKPQLNLAVNDPNRDFLAGQFFPYLIVKDHYGQRVLPENLGNIEYDLSEVDPTSNVVYTWEDLKMNADYAWVVRDGFASFFFHPYLLEPELNVPGLLDFQSLVTAITAMGYQWVGGQSLLTETPQ